MTAAAAVEPTELEELMKAQASTCSMATIMRSRT